MLYHIYSGHLFFSALAALVVVAVADLSGRLDRYPVLVSLERVVALCSIAFAALSGTPLPLWLAVPSVAVGLGYVMAGIGAPMRRRVVAGAATVVAAIACVVAEAPYHRGQTTLQQPARIIIVGDSLSSGGFGESTTWPDALGRRTRSDVVNLSRPSDTIHAAVEGQLPDIPAARAGDLVILEIGGNDMLEGLSLREFNFSLAVLSGGVSSSGRRAVMFELPLLPAKWGYGAAQRRAARDYGIPLIPKRVLAGVLLVPENTHDGLHLTQNGHDALARAVAEWAGW